MDEWYAGGIMFVLDIKNLQKKYGSSTAVKDVSLHVEKGEILGLLGPNGAGKTTTFTMILGVLEPSSGSILIDGIDLKTHRADALSRTNFAAVYAQLPGNLTVVQNLRIFGMLYQVQNLEVRISELLKAFDLSRFRDTKAGILSSGEQTRVGLAKALINRPKLLLLDEPTASLDPSSAQIIRERIRAYADRKEGGVLWTSHNMHEVADVCDRAIFMSRGLCLLEGDPKLLPGQHGKKSLDELFITVAREPLTLE